MYSNQKKIAAFGLVLLLAIPLVFSVVIIVRQKVLQASSSSKFDTEIIQTISLPKNDINWVKKGKEILIGGKYFDVKSFRTDGDHVLLTGYYDRKEDKLVSHIKKLFQQKDRSESPINQTAVKFLFFPTFTTHSEISIEANWHSTANVYFSYTEKIPEAPSLSFIHPPEL